jgi:hypothetical protein
MDALEALLKAYKKYLEVEATSEADTINKAARQAAEKRKEFDEARKRVKELCPEKQIHGFSLRGGTEVEVMISPDASLSFSQYKALQVLKKLPKKTTGGGTIKLEPQKGGEEVIDEDESGNEVKKALGGTYVGKPEDPDEQEDVVTIYDWNKKDNFFDTPQLMLLLKHEFGHRALRLLTDPKKTDAAGKTGKQLWDEFWGGKTGGKPNKDLVSKGGKMPKGYARRNASEGFAVCFELYFDDETLDPDTKAKLEEILKLLK